MALEQVRLLRSEGTTHSCTAQGPLAGAQPAIAVIWKDRQRPDRRKAAKPDPEMDRQCPQCFPNLEPVSQGRVSHSTHRRISQGLRDALAGASRKSEKHGIN